MTVFKLVGCCGAPTGHARCYNTGVHSFVNMSYVLSFPSNSAPLSFAPTEGREFNTLFDARDSAFDLAIERGVKVAITESSEGQEKLICIIEG